MVEATPLNRQDEQYPLLKVDGGGGDGVRQPPPAVANSGWNVTCTPKQTFLDRWPEFVSACWMTLILLGISMLVFYAVGISAYRRQSVIVIKCNATKPASDVYYHHIIQQRNYMPFLLFSDYLSHMAVEYPFLRFNVIFLIDDSLQSNFRPARHSRFFNKLLPYSFNGETSSVESFNRFTKDFQRRYQNVNVTVIPLSNYMATTPLRYKWRTIPTSYLLFYSRIFSVWQNGGIGMDLIKFNNYFNNRQYIDRRITTILKQHNDGIKAEEYANMLNNIDREEDSEVFTMLYGLMHQLLNQTWSFFNRSLSVPEPTPKTTISSEPLLIRKHRNKRDLFNQIRNASNKTNIVKNIAHLTELVMNSTESVKKNLSSNEPLSAVNLTKVLDKDNKTKQNNFKYIDLDLKGLKNVNAIQVFNNTKSNAGITAVNNSEIPQVVLFYDFSIFSDSLGPSYLLPDSSMHDFKQDTKNLILGNYAKPAKHSNLLSIDSEGVFVAATARYHPFLGHLISSGCLRTHPRYAIQDTFLTQCSGLFRDDTYCNNIYII